MFKFIHVKRQKPPESLREFPLFQRLTEELADREEEVRRLQAKIRSLEEALAELEAQLHQAELERNKVSPAAL